LAIFRVDQDRATGCAFVDHAMADISSWLPLLNSRDVIANESVAERLIDIDLGAVAELIGGLMLQRPGEAFDLFLKLLAFAVVFGILL
jgi:hypothetical protein